MRIRTCKRWRVCAKIYTMAQGIILAGGLSTRAETNKLLLVIKNKPLICHTIDNMRPFVDKIVVVTGRYHNELLPYLNDVEVVKNDNYVKGMFSSVKVGVSHINDDFFILPGDTPFVSKKVYESLLKGTFSIRVPLYVGKKGHPVFLKKENSKKILEEPDDSNLKNYIEAKGFESIEVDDDNCLTDIDTKEDYLNLLKKLERK